MRRTERPFWQARYYGFLLARPVTGNTQCVSNQTVFFYLRFMYALPKSRIQNKLA